MSNPFFRNVEFIKANGKAFLENMNYTEVVYEGADGGLLGGYVWFQAKHVSDSQFIYTIQLRKQGNTLKYTNERIINKEVKGLMQTQAE